MAEALSIAKASMEIIILIYSQIHKIITNFFNEMFSGTSPLWRKWGPSKLNRKKITPITMGVDALATAKKAKIAIQGIIERTPSTHETSPVVVLRILQVNGKPTLAIISNSDHYNDQLKAAVDKSDELDVDALGLEVMTKEQLFAIEQPDGEERVIRELAAGISNQKRGEGRRRV
jgi:hypothetical protein